MSIKIDPKLDEALASTSQDTMQVVFALKQPENGFLSEIDTETQARELLAAVKAETGIEPLRCNIFKYLGSFAVEAKPSYVRAILDHHEFLQGAVISEE